MPTIITRGAASARGFGFAGAITAKFSITAGTGGDGFGSVGIGYAYGDLYYGPFGSCTPAYPSPFAGAKLFSVFDNYINYTTNAGIYVEFDGFPTGDPGKSWFKSVSANGVTYLTSSASCNYVPQPNGPNTAGWGWTSPASGFGFVVGNTYTVTFVK